MRSSCDAMRSSCDPVLRQCDAMRSCRAAVPVQYDPAAEAVCDAMRSSPWRALAQTMLRPCAVPRAPRASAPVVGVVLHRAPADPSSCLCGDVLRSAGSAQCVGVYAVTASDLGYHLPFTLVDPAGDPFAVALQCMLTPASGSVPACLVLVANGWHVAVLNDGSPLWLLAVDPAAWDSTKYACVALRAHPDPIGGGSTVVAVVDGDPVPYYLSVLNDVEMAPNTIMLDREPSAEAFALEHVCVPCAWAER